tara:strand:- start:224 stop:376 length:153 start_codon:yes stop_codon:yes gene_type:complete
METWITNNWEYVVIGFFVIEKIVKLSPTKADDIAFDMILKPLFNKFKPKK